MAQARAGGTTLRTMVEAYLHAVGTCGAFGIGLVEQSMVMLC